MTVPTLTQEQLVLAWIVLAVLAAVIIFLIWKGHFEKVSEGTVAMGDNYNNSGYIGGNMGPTTNLYGAQYFRGDEAAEMVVGNLPAGQDIEVMSLIQDGPTLQFCEELRSALRAKGFTVKNAVAEMIGGIPMFKGVQQMGVGSPRLLVGDVRKF
ncbi:hypothetical protein [Brevundimonas sp. CEF1]|uniref:hypothetical protein n=1 Tax=Brevundimonas sp. CEF1 TaxID=3442642 RepID=UPI003F5173E5